MTPRADSARWPSPTGLLLHGAWGLSPWGERSLPVQERDLPPGFLQLSETDQAKVMDAALLALFDWAAELGCQRLRVNLPWGKTVNSCSTRA